MANCFIKNCNPPGICCTNGNVCDKTCINVEKVFDACLQQRSVSATLEVDFGEETPVSVVSVTSSGTGTVSNLTITPIPGTNNSRVTYQLSVPVTVTATNQSNNTIYGTSTMTFDEDIVMRVPQDGVIAPTVDGTAVINGVQNSIDGTSVTTNACVTVITKVIAQVILVVPAYGYLILPPAQEYTQEACGGIFNTPIFPR